MTRLVPDEEQQAAIERMVNEPTRAALNASQYGTGKTLVTVEVGQQVAPQGVKLIVCPLFTKYSWEHTILGQFPDASVRHINSRKAGQEALADLVSGVPGWYIVGREYFATKRFRTALNDGSLSGRIDFLAYDECQKWANRNSQGFKWMKKVKPGYKMALSATPLGNKFENFYAIHQWLWPKLEGHASFWKWVADWCETENDYFAGVQIKGEKNPGEFAKSLPCYVRLTKDFGDPIEQQVFIELSPKERAIYDKFEKHLIVWLNENPLIAKLPITKRLRLRQMTLGEVSINPETEAVEYALDMKSTKYDTLVDILREAEEPAVIFTDSAKYANVVAVRLVRDGFKALPWTGEYTEDVRHALKDAFVRGEIDYIVATIPSIGEGVDGLQLRARLMVWLSRSENNMLNQQAFRRLYRRGQKHQVVSIDIVALDTYDEGQLSSLNRTEANMLLSLRKG